MQVVQASFGAYSQRVQRQSFVKNQPFRFEGESPPAQISHLYFAGQKRKVMTYNVENFYRTKTGKWVKDKAAVQAVADVILKQDPDIVCLQEAGDTGLMSDFNKRYLNGKYPNVYGSPVKNTRGVQNVVYLTKADITLESIKSHLKDICPPKGPTAQDLTTAIYDCGKRDILEAKFRTDTGYELTIMNAHLKSMVGGEQQTMPKRLADAKIIGQIIDKLIAGDPDAHIMLVGDMNTLHDTPYGKPVITELTRTGDTDPANDMTETMLKDNKPTATHRGGTTYGNNKLDYMFVSKGLLPQVSKAYVAGYFNKDPWMKASDHRPMVTMFEEPDPPTAGAGNGGVPQAPIDTPISLKPGQQLDKIA